MYMYMYIIYMKIYIFKWVHVIKDAKKYMICYLQVENPGKLVV